MHSSELDMGLTESSLACMVLVLHGQPLPVVVVGKGLGMYAYWSRQTEI